MLECSALLSRLPFHSRYLCFASLLLVAEALAGETTTPAMNASHGSNPPQTDPSATSVFPDVRWVGLCNDRRALEGAIRERGSKLQEPGVSQSPAGHDRFTLDVNVRPSRSGQGYAARVSIASDSGAHDVRRVEADRCDELHSAVAWVLVVLAQRPRVGVDDSRESDATTQSADHAAGTGSAEATPSGTSPGVPDSSARPPSPGEAHERVPAA